MFYIYIFPEEKYNLSITSRRRKKRIVRELEKDILENYGQNVYHAHQNASRAPETRNYNETPITEASQSSKNTATQNNNRPGEYHTLNGDINNIIKHW